MRHRFNILIPALGAMIMIIVGIAWVQSTSTSSPDPRDLGARCGTCHQMEREIATWQQGSHRDVACTACHADKGVWGWLHTQVGQRRMSVVARWGELQAGGIDTDVPNRRCVECHARQMPFVMQDLKPPLAAPMTQAAAYPPPPPVLVPATAGDSRAQLAFMPATAGHDLHLAGQPGLRCTDCHSGTSHGPRPDIREGRDAFHNLCQDCHDQKGVVIPVRASVSCAACHDDLARVTPADHARDWRSQHGQASRNQTCGECHLDDSAGPHGPLSRPAAFPRIAPAAATASNCTTCHGLALPHPAGWLAQHPAQFQQQPAVCADCHGTRGQPLGSRFTGNPASLPNTPGCRNCHQTPVPHQPGYLKDHGGDALARGAATCARCHSRANLVSPRSAHATPGFCSDCHAGVPMPHPPGFVASHGQAALVSGQAACDRCHSPTSPVRPLPDRAAAGFCTSCHAQPMPHPAGYLARHGQEAVSAPGTCRTCHSPANPLRPDASHAAVEFCTRCHAQPMPHPPGYLAAHGQQAEQAPATCVACHSPATALRTEAPYASANFCTQCHAQPMPHAADFAASHGAEARKAPATCQTCHSPANPARPAAAHAATNYCAACHDTYRHPAGWVAAHGTRVNQSCAACHTEQRTSAEPRNSCTACHQSPATFRGQDWHQSPYWFVTHGQAALAQGGATCQKCHAEVKPSCAQCHRNR